jgi:L-lactate utilization protein LutC
MSREAFLRRVRAAVESGRAYRVHPCDEAASRAGYVGAGDDLCARLAAEVGAAGGTAHEVDDLAAARRTLVDLLRRHNAHSALCWRHELLARLGLDELLASLSIERLDYDGLCQLEEPHRRERVLAADVGITSVDFAIAETGTLAMLSRPGQERLASLAPPLHVAVVESRQVIADLLDLFAALDVAGPDALPSNLTLITGPSKTGDIELELTTGVHGPGQWHVVIARRGD